MSWELIRDIGLIMFIGGGFLLFAISASRYLDPPQKNEKIRVLVDSWMWSIGDGMMIAGACVALLGMAGDFAHLYYMRTLMSDTTSVTMPQFP